MSIFAWLYLNYIVAETLKEKTAKGLFWGFTNNGVQQLIGLAFGIILGRLLDQADYGMMTMIAIFPLIAKELQNSGFTVALTNMKVPTHRDYNSVFWFNIIVGCGLYLLLFLVSPLIAKFYHEQELVSLCRYAFLTIPLSALGTAQSAVLFKNLKVKQQAKAGMFSVLISSIIGAAMAWMGCKYWSLATQSIVYIGLNTMMIWHYSPWRPTLEIDFEPVRRMFPFSCKMLATNIAIHINNNVLNILLGRFFTKEIAGTYSQANTWSSKAAYLVQGMVQQVAQPILVGLNDERDRQLMVLRKMMRFTAFITFPLMFGLAMVAKEFIILAITEKWIKSAELMQYLCVSWASIPLTVLLSNMILSKGKSGTYFWCTITLAVLQLVQMAVLARYGMRTMVIGFVVLTCLWLFVWHHFTRLLTGYRLDMFLKDIIPFALVAFGVMVITHYLTLSIANLWLLFFSRIVIAALLYFIIMKVAHAKILDECIQYIRKKK